MRERDVGFKEVAVFSRSTFSSLEQGLATLDNNSDSPTREELMKRCEQAIQYEFKDASVLRRSLTHSSAATTRLDCNERLEFLGDAILGVVICEYLFARFPDRREGQLTQQKSHLVSRAVCTDVGNRLKLHEFIFVGKGLPSIPDSLKAAVVESVIAAIYMDGGLEKAREFILRAFEPELEDGGDSESDNSKSLLQEETQKHGSLVPQYEILKERGPDHAREFQVSVSVGEQQFVGDWARSKKLAEQDAAFLALSGFQLSLAAPDLANADDNLSENQDHNVRDEAGEDCVDRSSTDPNGD